MPKRSVSLTPQSLRQYCDPKQFRFETTADLKETKENLGQERALNALNFGIEIQQSGYNLYAMGPPGVGKSAIVDSLLKKRSAELPAGSDWCYVNNFNSPQKPIALKLPPGIGTSLQQDMEILIDDLRIAIPAVFESEEFNTRLQEIDREFKAEQEKNFSKIQNDAENLDLKILSSAHGFTVTPVKKSKVLSAEEYAELPQDEQKKWQKKIDKIQDQLEIFLEKIPKRLNERRKKEKDLQKDFTRTAVWQLIVDLKHKYSGLPDVLKFLDDIQMDVVENVRNFYKPEEGTSALLIAAQKDTLFFNRYKINIIVDNKDSKGCPIVSENNPNYSTLIGNIEHQAHFGALISDFTLIKAGALHRANGGYLMLDAARLLTQPYAWESLKRALYTKKIEIESLMQKMGLSSTVSLNPEPIPLDIKIILYGDRNLYYLLCTIDPEFNELFKVTADFEDHIIRNHENREHYVELLAGIIHHDHLQAFHRTAIAKVIEQSARIVGDAERLSIHLRSLSDLLREADYWAKKSNAAVVNAEHVEKAIAEKIHRLDRIRERMYEEINRGDILIDTDKEVIGQINALTVVELGDFTFGQPTRITATTWSGHGDVIDIEKEVELSGSLHSKGVLILAGFLGDRFAKSKPLSLSASLVFEQNYNLIDGDSASSAELCAILSALSDIPIKQSLAVTGSINQHGQIQPVGGVNEKIEGFFDICRHTGLTKNQGVIIPHANIKHLMLRQDVIDAVAAKQFHIYAVENIDEMMTLLTDRPAGTRNKSGNYSKNSINSCVDKCLLKYFEVAKKK